ncbi:MAG: prepilin-type N-terminal cleavage/methylation domain-containing protein [Clostridiales bacterium]|nr:prepilin-type N-terminal cleavage/methylation domain-containing protein [Clostridiales bacterium]
MKPHEAGFTLIEALAAMAILSVVLLPVLSILRQTSRNAAYADQIYEADLHLSSLLQELAAAIRADDIWGDEVYGAGAFADLIQDFDERYQTERFAYAAVVQPLQNPDGFSREWRTDPGLSLEPAVLSGYEEPDADAPQRVSTISQADVSITLIRPPSGALPHNGGALITAAIYTREKKRLNTLALIAN